MMYPPFPIISTDVNERFQLFQKVMVDTLPSTNHLNSVLSRSPTKIKYEAKGSITEPDNGHKTESASKLDVKLESERLETFKTWKSDAVTPQALAKAGFYSLNPNSDLVKCAFCKAEICRWEDGDEPMEEHARWSPNCPFVKEKQSQSLPHLLRGALPPGQDVCGHGSNEIFPNSVPEGEVVTLLKSMIRSHEDLKTRLESFKDWPKSLKQKPTALAEAGFFYKGIGDQTMCFECGGGLKDWEDDDDPWEQHAIWFPECKFLVATKGREFVEQVQAKLKIQVQVPTSNVTKENENNEEKISKCEQGASASRNDDTKLCKICYSNEKEVVFIPCSHLVSCTECSLSLKTCPICRKRIDGTIRVFPS
jgi:baculoviral IAP repeat-containing protein 7/8